MAFTLTEHEKKYPLSARVKYRGKCRLALTPAIICSVITAGALLLYGARAYRALVVLVPVVAVFFFLSCKYAAKIEALEGIIRSRREQAETVVQEPQKADLLK